MQRFFLLKSLLHSKGKFGKSSSNVSQRDTVFVDPAIHSPSSSLTCCSALGSITLNADMSKIYLAIELIELDRDVHYFVWQCEIHWDGNTDFFHSTISSIQDTRNMSKLALVLDIAKTYDVLFTMKLRLIEMTCYLTLYISGGRSELCHLQG